MNARPRVISAGVVLLAGLFAALVAVVGAPTPTAAGGWAVGTVDEVPQAEPGETVAVGFTIRQHGVTPAELGTDPAEPRIGVTVVDADGTSHFSPATADGPVGHYVASVTVPEEAGAYEWVLEMGVFGTQPLGRLPVEAGPAPTDPGLWVAVRWVALGACLVLAVVAIGDFARARRRPVTTAVPTPAP